MLVAPPSDDMTSKWLAFLTPISVAILTLVNLWIAKHQAVKADRVATVAKQVAAQSQSQTEKILVLADKTHTLVNSQYGIALRLILEKALRIAQLSKDPEDEAEVVKARQKLSEHEGKQSIVDARTSEGTI
jgi:hypothetical protein